MGGDGPAVVEDGLDQELVLGEGDEVVEDEAGPGREMGREDREVTRGGVIQTVHSPLTWLLQGCRSSLLSSPAGSCPHTAS